MKTQQAPTVEVKVKHGRIDTADQAKLIRQQLKRVFPTTRFRVCISRNTLLGNAVYLRWTDGPTVATVKGVVAAYGGGGSGDVEDYQYNVETWLLPDGSATFGGCVGGGIRIPGASKVRFEGNCISTDRWHSRKAVQAALDYVIEIYGFKNFGYKLAKEDPGQYPHVEQRFDRPMGRPWSQTISEYVEEALEKRVDWPTEDMEQWWSGD